PIADEDERLARAVPQRDREHAPQVLDEVGSVLLVEMDNDLGVGIRGEPVSPRLETGPQIPVVVDLAVEHDPDRAVLVGQRLMTADQVDDAEAAHPEANRAVGVDTLVVWSPVDDRLAHRPDSARFDGLVAVFIELSGYAAHCRVIFFPRMRNGFPKC